MKKILILDKDDVTLRSLLQELQRYSDLEVIVANERQDINRALQQLAIDLVITDIEGTETCCFELIEVINQHFPDLPVDVLSSSLPAELESRLGALLIARRFTKPLKAKETAENIYRQLTNGAVGQLKGLSLTSVLQLMNMERKHCALTVHAPSGSGELFIHDGEIIAAKTATMTGTDAAYTIISWEKVRIDLHDKHFNVTQEIFEPFMQLIMEALRLKDEEKLPPVVASCPYNRTNVKQTAPVSVVEKHIIALFEHLSGVVEYSLYDKNNNMRFSQSQHHQPVKNLHLEQLCKKVEEIPKVFKAGAFKHMVISEKNGLRQVFFPFQDFTITVGLRRDHAVDQFLHQFKTRIDPPALF